MRNSFNPSRRKQKLETLRLLFVVFFAVFSVAAWWDGKKEKENEKGNEKENEKVVLSQPANQPLTHEGIQVKTVSIQKPPPLPKGLSEAQMQLIKKQSERQREEVARIQSELKEIINRTQYLQNQVKDNRFEIQNILERTRIHERILKNITVPRPIQSKQQIDAEEIVRMEKLRLIAVQARETQAQLRTIQQARPLKTTQLAPSDTKTSKTS
ncbi:MAG: hypothetical protein HY351_02960 [Candidatus Omnitrophica bacterium]|nr:hypothetical protein [Candidatus Omnitrophota bacterium]